MGRLETFAPIEGPLAERHSVWVDSRRGRGGSGDGPDYGLDREVEDVLAVLAAAGDHAHLVGHSGGAMYCLFAATQRPSLRSLVLYEPPLRRDRFDPIVVDGVQAALDAGDPDRALEIFFPTGVAVEEEARIIRSLPEVWARVREGVCLVRRELRTAQGAIKRLTASDPPDIPTAMFDRSDGTTGGGCGIFDSSVELDISAEDGRRIRKAGRRLNTAVRAAAEKHGWVFVDGIEAGFAGHGYCSDDSFFVFAEDSCRQQGDFEGTMHPTAAGHAVYSRCLQAAIARHLFPKGPLVPTTPQVPDDDVVAGAAEA